MRSGYIPAGASLEDELAIRNRTIQRNKVDALMRPQRREPEPRRDEPVERPMVDRRERRPREHRSRSHARRGPPGDADPSGDLDPPLNRCKQQAEELTPEQLDDLRTFARIRAKWLRTGRRWST
jgi:hypothetical protein